MNQNLFAQLPPEQATLYSKECAALHKRYTSFLKHPFLLEYLEYLNENKLLHQSHALDATKKWQREYSRISYQVYNFLNSKDCFRASYIESLERIGRKYERYLITSDNPASPEAHAEPGGDSGLPLL